VEEVIKQTSQPYLFPFASAKRCGKKLATRVKNSPTHAFLKVDFQGLRYRSLSLIVINIPSNGLRKYLFESRSESMGNSATFCSLVDNSAKNY